MSNPYTQPSISGYNASPPPDDGTEVTANQLGWQKHLDKIGGPLKTFVEGVDSATLAAFGLVFGAAILQKTGAYTVTTADRGRFISVTNATTITLLSAVTAGSGFPLLIVNAGTDVVTVDGDSSETINGSVTQTLNPGYALIISSDGSGWYGVNTDNSSSGSFTPTHTGFSGAPSGDIFWNKQGNIVNLRPAFTDGTSNSTLWTITNWPAALQVDATVHIPLHSLSDNSALVTNVGLLVLTSGSAVAQFYTDMALSAWTGSGLKGFYDTGGALAARIMYSLKNTT